MPPEDASGVPAAVLELLRTRVQALEDLEVLLLVSEGSIRSWSASEAAERLHSPVDPTLAALQRLHGVGLLESPSTGLYRYSPTTSDQRHSIEELRNCYASNRLAILKQLNERAMEQMRKAMLHTLAEAFRLRRREP